MEPHPDAPCGPLVDHSLLPWSEQVGRLRLRQRVARLRAAHDGRSGRAPVHDDDDDDDDDDYGSIGGGTGAGDDGGDQRHTARMHSTYSQRFWTHSGGDWQQEEEDEEEEMEMSGVRQQTRRRGGRRGRVGVGPAGQGVHHHQCAGMLTADEQVWCLGVVLGV